MFKIKKEAKTLNVTSEEVFRNILREMFLAQENTNLKDVDIFIKDIHNLTKSKLLDMSVSQLLEIHFMAGYYYRIFLEKNNVEFTCKERDKS